LQTNGQGSIPSKQAGCQRETRHRITILKLVLGVVLVIENGKINLRREMDLVRDAGGFDALAWAL
jgi:hypothetical protein